MPLLLDEARQERGFNIRRHTVEFDD